MSKIDTEFTHYYTKAVKLEQDHDHDHSNEDVLRVSGLPYCGLQHIYRRMVQAPARQGFSSNYYLSVGTDAHTAIQEALGRRHRMLGNWLCTSPFCECKVTLSTYTDCPVCGSAMSYEEIEVDVSDKYPMLLPCHLDGIYIANDGTYWVVDYKTTTASIIKSKNSKLPYSQNVAQISAYCALVHYKYNIPIKGWILYYVSRDKPITVTKAISKVTPNSHKREILKRLKVYDSQYKMVLTAKSFKTVIELETNKPCRSHSHYLKKYKKYDDCPLAHICFDKPILMPVLKRLWENRSDDFNTWRRPLHLKTVK